MWTIDTAIKTHPPRTTGVATVFFAVIVMPDFGDVTAASPRERKPKETKRTKSTFFIENMIEP